MANKFNKKNLTKAGRYWSTYAITGQILFGEPVDKVSAIRAFFQSRSFFKDDE